MSGKSHVFDRFAVLFSVVIVWIYAHLLTVSGAYKNRSDTIQVTCRTDRAGIIDAAPWIQFGFLIHFNGELQCLMLEKLLLCCFSTGAFISEARYASATPIPPSVLSRGIGWQGVGILFSGIFGTGNGSSVSVENAGLLGLTRVGSRRVVQISAGFMIFFSILGKFGAVFASIPAPIVAALYCLFFAYVGSAGLGFLQFCNLNSFRWNDMVNVPFSSEAFVGGFLAMFLDVTLRQKDAATRKDRGMHWWDKYRSFKTDTRSEEFYSLPFNLNKFFSLEDDGIKVNEEVSDLPKFVNDVAGMKMDSGKNGNTNYDVVIKLREKDANSDFHEEVKNREKCDGNQDRGKGKNANLVVCELVQLQDYLSETVLKCDFQMGQERSNSLFFTLGMNGLGGNAGTFGTEFQTLNEILQQSTQNSNILMANSEATRKNGGSLGHLKLDLCKWPKRKKVADTKCKFQHGKWEFDIWKWPNRKKRLTHQFDHLSLFMNDNYENPWIHGSDEGVFGLRLQLTFGLFGRRDQQR
ncbi:nucleobase-ascorbate transporter 7 [Artemisia annua]|uniref:Nucleobase-ascorbate transporter 7 n=1 Tax=Artemisia annua TaxID=35608 RepID=A0A2U1QM09_ARTAN|nr:nucleobase-ascorbate transporter 7 [Artemisia annua]